jgi:hypothetical protein
MMRCLCSKSTPGKTRIIPRDEKSDTRTGNQRHWLEYEPCG